MNDYSDEKEENESEELEEIAENLADGYSASILSGIYSVNSL